MGKLPKKYLWLGTAIGLSFIIVGLIILIFQSLEPKDKNLEIGEFENFSGAVEEFYIDYGLLEQNPVDHPNFEILIVRIRENEAKLSDDESENDNDAYMGIGFDVNSLGDKEGGIRAYRAVLDINVRNFIALNNVAVLYKLTGQPEKAELAYLRLIDFNPGDPPNYRSLADIYRYQLPEKEKLIPELMNQILVRRPEHPDILSWLATYWQDKGEKDLSSSGINMGQKHTNLFSMQVKKRLLKD